MSIELVNPGSAIAYPCAIKGCQTWTKLNRTLRNDEFIVCASCENAVFVTVLAKMAQDGVIPHETPRQMAVVLNGWRRRRRGVATAIQPSSVGN